MIEPTEISWAAGLFDGEGAVTICGGRNRLSLKMVDEQTVLRFAAAVSAGKVYCPYRNRTGDKDGYPRKDFFMWVAEKESGKQVADLLSPYLSEVRKKRIAEVWS